MPHIETTNIANLPTELDRRIVRIMRKLIGAALSHDRFERLYAQERKFARAGSMALLRTCLVHECLDALENAPMGPQLQLSNLILGIAHKNCDTSNQALDERCFRVGTETARRIIREGQDPENNGEAPYLWHTLRQARHLLTKLSERTNGDPEREESVLNNTLEAVEAYAPRLPGEVGFLLENAQTLAQGNPQREARLLHATINVLAPYLLGIHPSANTREVTGLISKLSGVPLEEVGLESRTAFIPAEDQSGYPHQFLFTGDNFIDNTFVRWNGFVNSIRGHQRDIQNAEGPSYQEEWMDATELEMCARIYSRGLDRVPELKSLVNRANELFSRSRVCPDIHEAMAQLMETRGSRPDILPLFRQQMASPALSA